MMPFGIGVVVLLIIYLIIAGWAKDQLPDSWHDDERKK
jgi:hypothetical protein